MKNNRGALIALAIVIGIVLSCAILPLGGFALLLTATDSSDISSTTLPARTWQEQVVTGNRQSADERVLLLNVSGVIGAPDSGPLANSVSHSELLAQIRQATEDEEIAAVVLRIDSPGGGVVASDEIHNALVELRDTGKPLIVSMGSVAASGGYYIAAPADQIFANADTFTGSLGVIITLLNYEEALDTIGVRQLVFKSGEFKDTGIPSRELSDEEEAILQEIVDQAYQGFVEVIAEGRDMPRDEVERLADGRIYTGQQALELGLIDELGGRDDAIAAARELAELPDDALVVRYNITPDFLSLLRGSLEASQQPADPLGLRHLVDSQSPRLEYRMTP
jgi:protease-4